MQTRYPENWPQFFTATIHQWKHLLNEDRYKYVIIKSLNHLVKNGKVRINAFVIMSNHIHLIWQATGGNSLKDVQTSFKKFTSQQFIKLLKAENKLSDYVVSKADREHQFWKRNSLGVELFSIEAFEQKLGYIHANPVKAGLCNYPEEYRYSSAIFYEKQSDEFGILEHFIG